MKHLITITLIAFASIATVNAQYNKANLTLSESSGTAANQYRYEKLQLYPIRANHIFLNEHKNISNYVTLKEALASKKIAITEKSNQGTVNTLLIENLSKDTVIVLSGEVIQGGKQDRVIAEDIILYPKSGKKDIPVFCVEHGRWTARNGDRSFNQYFDISSNEVRKAATVKKDQSEVWQKVAETNQKHNTETRTGTLAAIKSSSELNDDVKKYAEHFRKLLLDDPNVIGVVAVSGNTILGCDMFANHDIFGKYLPNLLNSYATEAITSGSAPSVSYQQVRDYLDSIIDDESKQEEEVKKKGAVLKDGNKKVHISTF